jgi:hypothetical protein
MVITANKGAVVIAWPRLPPGLYAERLLIDYFYSPMEKL